MGLCQSVRWMGSVVSMGMLLVATTAFAADHVLIMAISNYARAPLPGVRHDPQNALQLAEKLGYDTAGATVLRDSDLSGQAMRQALQRLSDQVRSNDRLFFYFSGHGSSALVGSQCSSALVAQDEVLIDTNELKAHLVKAKAPRLRTPYPNEGVQESGATSRPRQFAQKAGMLRAESS